MRRLILTVDAPIEKAELIERTFRSYAQRGFSGCDWRLTSADYEQDGGTRHMAMWT